MIKIPSLNYEKIIKVLQKKKGWVIVRQKGSHIRLQKHTATEIFKITVPYTQTSLLESCPRKSAPAFS